MEVRHEFAAFVAFGDEGELLVQHPTTPATRTAAWRFFASRDGLPAGGVGSVARQIVGSRDGLNQCVAKERRRLCGKIPIEPPRVLLMGQLVGRPVLALAVGDFIEVRR